MVVITYKMKDSMNDDPVELIGKLSSVLDGILSYSVDADEQVTGKLVTFAVVECDDVCKVVMLEILLVDVKYIIVGTEDYRDVPYSSDFALCDKLQPLGIFGFALKNEVCIFEIV